jgi:hypothetical protein
VAASLATSAAFGTLGGKEELGGAIVAGSGLAMFFSRNNEKSVALFIVAAKFPAMFCVILGLGLDR